MFYLVVVVFLVEYFVGVDVYDRMVVGVGEDVCCVIVIGVFVVGLLSRSFEVATIVVVNDVVVLGFEGILGGFCGLEMSGNLVVFVDLLWFFIGYGEDFVVVCVSCLVDGGMCGCGEDGVLIFVCDV